MGSSPTPGTKGDKTAFVATVPFLFLSISDDRDRINPNNGLILGVRLSLYQNLRMSVSRSEKALEFSKNECVFAKSVFNSSVYIPG